MTVWYELRTMDGRILAATHGLKPEDKWPWILRIVMAEAECEEDHVNVEETKNGDVITVSGKPYARISRAVLWPFFS
jgi:hypothetical protein